MLEKQLKDGTLIQYPDFYLPNQHKSFSELTIQEQKKLFDWIEKYCLPHLNELPDYTASFIRGKN